MRSFLFFLLTLFFLSCEVKVSSSGSDVKKEEGYSRNDKKIRNGIKVSTAGDVDVKQAFLIYEDGSLVSEENITELKRPLKLRLILDGWKEEGGQVYLAASERVTTDEGDLVLDAPDLFSDIGPVSVKDSRVITLDVVVNGINKLVDHFLVEFRVWNKKHDQSVTGTYQFHINKM